jgi:hypothetical protein
MENKKSYPLTFLDYTIMVPTPGIIMFDEEMNPDHLCVRDGDIFKVSVKDGRISFIGISREKT